MNVMYTPLGHPMFGRCGLGDLFHEKFTAVQCVLSHNAHYSPLFGFGMPQDSEPGLLPNRCQRTETEKNVKDAPLDRVGSGATETMAPLVGIRAGLTALVDATSNTTTAIFAICGLTEKVERYMADFGTRTNAPASSTHDLNANDRGNFAEGTV